MEEGGEEGRLGLRVGGEGKGRGGRRGVFIEWMNGGRVVEM